VQSPIFLVKAAHFCENFNFSQHKNYSDKLGCQLLKQVINNLRIR